MKKINWLMFLVVSFQISIINMNDTQASSSGLFNFTAGDKAACERSISSRFSGSSVTCSIGGGCGVSCGMPSSSCTSANPQMWGACVNPANITAGTSPSASTGSSSGLVNFTAGDKTTCESSISTRFSGASVTCSIGGGCGVSCGMPSSSCTSANPQMWGACVNPANITAGTSTDSSRRDEYRGYMNGNNFIITNSITRAAALENCQTNARNNPTKRVECTWGRETIFTSAGSGSSSSQGSAISASDLYNFVAADKATCESSASSRLPGVSVTCSLGGGCGVSCGAPSSSCTSANPQMWGACIAPTSSSVGTSAGSLVPDDFNGEVRIATNPKNGVFDVLEGVQPAKGGGFDRLYNGISGMVSREDPLSASEYNIKYLDLASQIWGVTEVGEKMCKPTGKEFAKSLVNWWRVLKNYTEAEKQRDKLLQARVDRLKGRMDLITNNTSDTSLQLEGIKTQIESLNISIDSISGSSLFEDDKAAEVRATSRLAWREALLTAALQGYEESKTEDSEIVSSYFTCQDKVAQSLSIATRACENSTRDCSRTKEVTDELGNTSTVADPAPGSCELKAASCEMSNINIPLFQKVSMKDLETLYLVNPIPTKELNERLLRVLKFMYTQATVLFPRSPDRNYEWTEPLVSCLVPLTDNVKKYGVICPANASEKDYDKSKFDYIGKSDDLMMEMNHYTVGESFEPTSGGYAEINKNYNNLLADARRNSEANGQRRSEEELSNMAQRELWARYIQSPYSRNFVAGRRTDTGVDLKASLDYLTKVMNENNLTSTRCSPETCRPSLKVVPASSFEIVPSGKISESAQGFLSSMGIANGGSVDTTNFLVEKWNKIDLYFGQSHIRQHYFLYNENLIKELIESDRAKLGKLLTDREKLIAMYAKMKELFDGTKTNSIGGLASNTNANTRNAVSTNTSANVVSIGLARSAVVSGEPGQLAVGARVGTAGIAESISANQAERSIGVSVDGSRPLTIAGVSNGLLSYSPKLSGGASVANSSNGRNYSVSANRKINKIKSNIKNLDNGQRKLGVSGVSGASSGDSMQRIGSLLSSKPNESFMKGPGAVLISSFSAGPSLQGAAKGNKGATGSGSSYSSGSSGSNYGYGTTYSNSSGGHGSSRSGYSSTGNESNKAHLNNVTNITYPNEMAGMSDDEKKIKDAVQQRDRENSNKYQAESTDSLFDILTKAHIRNYQRVQK